MDYIWKNLKNEEPARRLGTIRFLSCDGQTWLKIRLDMISHDTWTGFSLADCEFEYDYSAKLFF